MAVQQDTERAVTPRLAGFAGWPVAGLGAALAALLIAFSGRYGYHRDELYFLACGRHLAWGYPDQPPLVPLLARLMSGLDATSLVLLRLPSGLASAVLVIVTGLLARELGGERAAQVLAAAPRRPPRSRSGSAAARWPRTAGRCGWPPPDSSTPQSR